LSLVSNFFFAAGITAPRFLSSFSPGHPLGNPPPSGNSFGTNFVPGLSCWAHPAQCRCAGYGPFCPFSLDSHIHDTYTQPLLRSLRRHKFYNNLLSPFSDRFFFFAHCAFVLPALIPPLFVPFFAVPSWTFSPLRPSRRVTLMFFAVRGFPSYPSERWPPPTTPGPPRELLCAVFPYCLV